MKQLYLDIKQRLLTKAPSVRHIAIFNNQIERLKNINEGDYTQDAYAFARPAVFIEFQNILEITQLGGGVQLYDPLFVVVHIVHDNYHNGGDMDLDLLIFDLKQEVYLALQKFEPLGAVMFIRTSEQQDYDHDNLYHYQMTFTTNYIEQSSLEPVGGIAITPALSLTTDLDIDNVVIRTGNGII